MFIKSVLMFVLVALVVAASFWIDYHRQQELDEVETNRMLEEDVQYCYSQGLNAEVVGGARLRVRCLEPIPQKE